MQSRASVGVREVSLTPLHANLDNFHTNSQEKGEGRLAFHKYDHGRKLAYGGTTWT
jgi:hypothetical protein